MSFFYLVQLLFSDLSTIESPYGVNIYEKMSFVYVLPKFYKPDFLLIAIGVNTEESSSRYAFPLNSVDQSSNKANRSSAVGS